VLCEFSVMKGSIVSQPACSAECLSQPSGTAEDLSVMRCKF
jgi:hypothetical protein